MPKQMNRGEAVQWQKAEKMRRGLPQSRPHAKGAFFDEDDYTVDENGCHLWLYLLRNSGAPVLHLGPCHIFLRQWMWEVKHGGQQGGWGDAGMRITAQPTCHMLCINPDHLTVMRS